MFNQCCIVNCERRRKDVILYRFPKSEIGLQKWLQCICDRLRFKNVDFRKLRICQKHFEKKFIASTSVRSRLRVGAYPTLFSDSEIKCGSSKNIYTVDCKYADSDHIYAKKRKHKDHNYSLSEPIKKHNIRIEPKVELMNDNNKSENGCPMAIEVKLINDNDKSENGCPMVIESNDNDNSNNDLNYNPMECMDHEDSDVVDPDMKSNTTRINIEKRVQSNKPEANSSVLSSTPLTPNVCRICLATDVKMYPIKDFQLRRIYQQLTGIVLNPEDQLPKTLCWECVGRLISAHKFRDKALRAHSLLTDIHIQTHANIQDFIISEIKCYSGLESTLTTKHFSNDDVNLVIFEGPDAAAEEKTSAFEEHENNNVSDVLAEVIVDDIDHMGPEEVILEVNDSEVSAKYYTELISDKDRPLREVFIENNMNTIKGTAESESKDNEFLKDSKNERTHEVLLQKIKKSKESISNKAKQYISPSDAIESWRIRNDSHFSSDSLGRRPGGLAPEEPRSAGAPLMCDQCGKKFRTRTGLKPFECESCGKCFTTLAEQRSRVEYVHLKVPWPKRTRGTTQTRRPTAT